MVSLAAASRPESSQTGRHRGLRCPSRRCARFFVASFLTFGSNSIFLLPVQVSGSHIFCHLESVRLGLSKRALPHCLPISTFISTTDIDLMLTFPLDHHCPGSRRSTMPIWTLKRSYKSSRRAYFRYHKKAFTEKDGGITSVSPFRRCALNTGIDKICTCTPCASSQLH